MKRRYRAKYGTIDKRAVREVLYFLAALFLFIVVIGVSEYAT